MIRRSTLIAVEILLGLVAALAIGVFGSSVENRLGSFATMTLILATGTWCAYNDWGGSNHYQGLCGPTGGDFAAEVSVARRVDNVEPIVFAALVP